MRSGAASRQQALDFCRLFCVKGICSLFMECSGERLLVDLQRSGRAFAHFTAIAPDDRKAASQSEPFFDALACKDFECAAAIARTAPTSWNRDDEYEEDFLYFRFLYSHCFLGADAQECEQILARYEAVLEGKTDARLAICRALLGRDVAAFESALSELLSAYEARYDALADAESVPEEVLLTEGNIFIEGLGLLALAERSGLSTLEEYPALGPSVSVAAAPATPFEGKPIPPPPAPRGSSPGALPAQGSWPETSERGSRPAMSAPMPVQHLDFDLIEEEPPTAPRAALQRGPGDPAAPARLDAAPAPAPAPAAAVAGEPTALGLSAEEIAHGPPGLGAEFLAAMAEAGALAAP